MNIHINKKLKKALMFFLFALFVASPVLKAADEDKKDKGNKQEESSKTDKDNNNSSNNEIDLYLIFQSILVLFVLVFWFHKLKICKK